MATDLKFLTELGLGVEVGDADRILSSWFRASQQCRVFVYGLTGLSVMSQTIFARVASSWFFGGFRV